MSAILRKLLYDIRTQPWDSNRRMTTNERGAHRSNNARLNAARTRAITTGSTNEEMLQPKTTRPQRARTSTEKEDDIEHAEHEGDHARKRNRKRVNERQKIRTKSIQCRNSLITMTTRASESRYDTCPTEPQCIHALVHPVNTTRRQTTKHDDVYAHVHKQRTANARTRIQAKERDAKLRYVPPDVHA